jgi:hypothetical protein
MVLIFVFAHPTIRKKAYNWFWLAHSLYVFLFALMLIHGLARITGPPRFWIYFIGPGVVFILDKVRDLVGSQMTSLVCSQCYVILVNEPLLV